MFLFSVKVSTPPVSHTFAAHFSNFCRQDLGWESLTDRIRASGRRIRSRTDLAVSSPPFCPRILSKVDMSPPSYREEKKLERERAKKEKARIKSDRTVMAGTLEDSKLRSLEKTKHQPSESGSRSRQLTSKASVSAGKKLETPTSGSGKALKDPAGKDPEKRAADKKRKQPEEISHSPPCSSRPRQEEKGAKLKGVAEDAPQNLVVLSSRESETRESERRNVPLPGNELIVCLSFRISPLDLT